MEGEERKRRVKLLCPILSSSKIVQIIAQEDHKLDLGFIARVFGLEPNTLKLNGHFISRGIDLIAYSVTWKSLINYFSARGLSTGASDSDALVVQGKLSKIGSKRSHEPSGNGTHDTSEQGHMRRSKKPQLEYGRLLNKDDQCEESSSEQVDASKCNGTGPNCLNLKRKLCLEDGNNVKRSRSDEAGLQDRNCGTSTSSRSSCSFISAKITRMRDDDMVAASP